MAKKLSIEIEASIFAIYNKNSRYYKIKKIIN